MRQPDEAIASDFASQESRCLIFTIPTNDMAAKLAAPRPSGYFVAPLMRKFRDLMADVAKSGPKAVVLKAFQMGAWPMCRNLADLMRCCLVLSARDSCTAVCHQYNCA